MFEKDYFNYIEKTFPYKVGWRKDGKAESEEFRQKASIGIVAA